MPERFFLKIRPFQTHFNPFIKVAFMADTIFWATWSTVLPLLSVFVVGSITGATIQTVAIGYSMHVLSRILGDFISSRLSKLSEKKLVLLIVLGTLIVNVSYLGFLLVRDPYSIFLVYMVAGFGIGLASPLRASLFSKNIDRDQEARDWATIEILILGGIAMGTAAAGLIITQFGFNAFFALAFVFSFTSIFPYLYYIVKHAAKN